MASFAQQLRLDSNCAQDHRRQNHLVTQAYNGLIAYEPLYRAGCQQDAKQNYCFANAITNTSSPSDSYIYYLPLGIPLPGPSKPSCSSCLLNTMNIFQEAAANRSQPITANYVEAAQMIAITCGPTFINTSLPAAVGSAGSVSLKRPFLVSGFSFALLLVHLAVFF